MAPESAFQGKTTYSGRHLHLCVLSYWKKVHA